MDAKLVFTEEAYNELLLSEIEYINKIKEIIKIWEENYYRNKYEREDKLKDLCREKEVLISDVYIYLIGI